MSKNSVRTIINMAIKEPDFRKELLENPKEALAGRGIDLEPEQIKTLEAIAKEDIGVISDELNQRLAKVSEVERSY